MSALPLVCYGQSAVMPGPRCGLTMEGLKSTHGLHRVFALFDTPTAEGHDQEACEPATSGTHGSGRNAGLLLLVPLRLGLGKVRIHSAIP